MTKKEEKIILEALEKCKERIERSFDYFIDDIKETIDKQPDHCCSMTPKEDLCGDIEGCEFCASRVPDLADLVNDNLNER